MNERAAVRWLATVSLALVVLPSSPMFCRDSSAPAPHGQVAQYEPESAEQRKRDLESPSNRQNELDLGGQRQRDLEQPNQRNVEDPDERQEDLELGGERQREVEGRDNY